MKCPYCQEKIEIENKEPIEILPNAIYTVSEAAKYLRVSPITLKRWGDKGYFKPSFRIGSRGDRRYYGKDLLSFGDKV